MNEKEIEENKTVYFYCDDCHDSISFFDNIFSNGYYERSGVSAYVFVEILRRFLERHKDHSVKVDFY